MRVVRTARLVVPRLLRLLLLLLRLDRVPLGPVLRALFIRRRVVGLELLLKLGTGVVCRGRAAGKAGGRVRWVVGRGSGYVAWF